MWYVYDYRKDNNTSWGKDLEKYVAASEENPHRIVDNKMPWNDKCKKKNETGKLTDRFIYQKIHGKKYEIQQQMTTNGLQAPNVTGKYNHIKY